jgi:hypothetical protein
VLARLKKVGNRLRKLPPGERFQTFHREQRNQSPAVKAAFLGAAVLSVGAGGVLTFVPGPAILFFGLAAALLAAQSLRVARWLDHGEVRARKAFAALRRWRRSRRSRR